MDHQYLPRHIYPSVDADPAPSGSTIIAELPGRGRDSRNLPDWTASMADLNIYNGLFRSVDMSHRNPVPASALPATGPMPIQGGTSWDPARVSPVRTHRGRHARRHRWLRRLGLAAVLAILVGGIAWAGLGGPLPSNPFAPHGGTPSVSAPVSATPSHAGASPTPSPTAVHVVKTAYRVIFRVTGSGQADNISYGSESQLISKPDITAVPFTASLPWDSRWRPIPSRLSSTERTATSSPPSPSGKSTISATVPGESRTRPSQSVTPTRTAHTPPPVTPTKGRQLQWQWHSTKSCRWSGSSWSARSIPRRKRPRREPAASG